MARDIDAQRSERREAGRGVAKARRAARESEKLATSLEGKNRTRLEVITRVARKLTRAAARDVREHPRRASRLARVASTKLEQASVRATASVDAARRAGAESDAKQRAKTIKRRRAQEERILKMAEYVVLHTVVASVTAPTDRKRAASDFKHFQRMGERTSRATRA